MSPFRHPLLALLLAQVLALQPLIAGACTADRPPGLDAGAAISVGRMAGLTWVAVTVAGVTLPEGLDIGISVSSDGVVSGRTGCNSLSGKADLDAGQMVLGPLTVTEMGCDPALMKIEAAYLAALAEVVSFAVSSDGFFYLGRADGTTAVCLRP